MLYLNKGFLLYTPLQQTLCFYETQIDAKVEASILFSHISVFKENSLNFSLQYLKKKQLK